MTTPVPPDRSAAPTEASSDRSVPVPPPADGPAPPDGATATGGPVAPAPPAASDDSASPEDTTAGSDRPAGGGSVTATSAAAASAPAARPATGGDRPARSSHRRVETPVATPSRGVYLVPALLVVALVLLVVGLVTGASVWLAASLGASVLAAVLLVAERLVQRRRAAAVARAPATSPDTTDTDDAVVDLEFCAIDPDDPDAVWVVDGRPRYHVRGCETLTSLPAEPISRTQALEDGFVACSLCEPGVGSRAQPGR